MKSLFVFDNYNKQYSIRTRIFRVLLSLIILTIGGLIYIAFRVKSLAMFDWFEKLGLSKQIDYLRDYVQGEGVYGWIKYSLPDGLWIFSYMFIVDSIWNGERNTFSTFCIWGLPIVAILSECLQLLDLCPGVFDWMDMASYILAVVLFLIVKLLK